MIRAVLIDDEVNVRRCLRNYLQTYSSEILVVAEADSVQTGIHAINTTTPDVIFLDVMLSDGSGFSLLKQFSSIEFKIVFVSADSRYAMKAFKFNAFDYLLKPFDIDELQLLITRLKKELLKNTINYKSYREPQLNLAQREIVYC